MKIQPIDTFEQPIRTDSGKYVMKSRLKRLFDRPFPSVLRAPSAMTIEKPAMVGKPQGFICEAAGLSEFEPSSACLTKMVQNFIESNENDKPAPLVKCGRSRCNCFHGNNNYSSDDELDAYDNSADPGFGVNILKSLIQCTSAAERNLLADTAKIIDNNKIYKRKNDLIKTVVDGLLSQGYIASICKSRWDKSPSHPAGEYEYIDATVENERLLIDIDFRSEFEIARSAAKYKAILQSLPYIFVGKSDRLRQIVTIVSESAKQSYMKKDMFFPPWRKAEYMRAKWLSPYTKTTPSPSFQYSTENLPVDVISGDQMLPSDIDSGGFSLSSPVVTSPWQPPAIKPKSCDNGAARVVTGLAFLLKEIA